VTRRCCATSASRSGQTAYRIVRNRFELTGLELDEDERQALQLAVATVRSDVGQEGLWKLGGSVAGAAAVMADVPQLEQLPSLRAAAGAHHTVTFSYRGSSRRLDPYGLLLRGGFWYVIGHDHGHDQVRTYRVDRIEGEVDVDPASDFDRPDDFDPEASFPADPKLLGDGRPIDAMVWVSAVHAGEIRRELGDDAVVEERADGSVVVGVPTANLDAFRSWVLGLGADAEVLGPPELRRTIVDWLQSIVERSVVRG
jgi:proteasome accessory factor B